MVEMKRGGPPMAPMAPIKKKRMKHLNEKRERARPILTDAGPVFQLPGPRINIVVRASRLHIGRSWGRARGYPPSRVHFGAAGARAPVVIAASTPLGRR
jgi:hypothetical protein